MIDGDRQEDATVQVKSGLFRGVACADGTLNVFKGIPYAAPPVGSLRWRPPLPALAWDGVRVADRFGPICPQFGPPPPRLCKSMSPRRRVS